MRIYCDDGSTAVKVAFFDNKGMLQTLVSENSFREGWKVDGFGNETTFNYIVDNQKYTFDPVSTDALITTNVEYQYSTENLLAVHHALLKTGLKPQPIELWVTLPVSEYYTADSQKNEANIQRKRKNLQRLLTLNKGKTFNINEVHVLPESLPAVFEKLLTDNVGEFETSLVVDLGGTTLDCGAIVGRFNSVSKVTGEQGLGVNLVTYAVLNILKQAGSETSHLIADRLIREKDNDDLFNQIVNDASKIDLVKQTIDTAITRLGEQVIGKLQQYKGINRIYLTGGGALLIASAVKNAWQVLGDKVQVMDMPQIALVRAIAEMNREDK